MGWGGVAWRGVAWRGVGWGGVGWGGVGWGGVGWGVVGGEGGGGVFARAWTLWVLTGQKLEGRIPGIQICAQAQQACQMRPKFAPEGV